MSSSELLSGHRLSIDLTWNQATRNIAIVIILIPIATISVAGRLIARGKYGPGLSLDD